MNQDDFNDAVVSGLSIILVCAIVGMSYVFIHFIVKFW